MLRMDASNNTAQYVDLERLFIYFKKELCHPAFERRNMFFLVVEYRLLAGLC